MNLSISPRRSGKTAYSRVISKTYIDYAASTGRCMMLGTSNPGKWGDYLKSNHPATKFKIVEHGIIINPRD